MRDYSAPKGYYRIVYIDNNSGEVCFWRLSALSLGTTIQEAKKGIENLPTLKIHVYDETGKRVANCGGEQ